MYIWVSDPAHIFWNTSYGYPWCHFVYIVFQLTQEQLIDDKSNQRKEKLSCALVFFKTLKARAAALQSVWTTDPFQFNLSPAPEPNEIVWKNLNNHYYIR